VCNPLFLQLPVDFAPQTRGFVHHLVEPIEQF
jgi:hypothetical protein